MTRITAAALAAVAVTAGLAGCSSNDTPAAAPVVSPSDVVSPSASPSPSDTASPSVVPTEAPPVTPTASPAAHATIGPDAAFEPAFATFVKDVHEAKKHSLNAYTVAKSAAARAATAAVPMTVMAVTGMPKGTEATDSTWWPVDMTAKPAGGAHETGCAIVTPIAPSVAAPQAKPTAPPVTATPAGSDVQWFPQPCATVLNTLFAPSSTYYARQLPIVATRQIAAAIQGASATAKTPYTAANIIPGFGSLLSSTAVATGTTVTAFKKMGCINVMLPGSPEGASAQFTLGKTGTVAVVFPDKDCVGPAVG